MKYLKLSDLRKASWYDVFGAEVEVWWHCHLKERTWCKLTTWLDSPIDQQTKLMWGLTCSQWSPQELAELLEFIIGSEVGGLIFLNDQEKLTKSTAWNEMLHWANTQACNTPDHHQYRKSLFGTYQKATRFLRRKAQKSGEKCKKVDFTPIPWQSYLPFMEVTLPSLHQPHRDTDLGLNPVLATRARQWFATGHRPRPLQLFPRNHSNTPPPRGTIGGWTLQGRPISPNIPRTSRPLKWALGPPMGRVTLARVAGLRNVHKWRNLDGYNSIFRAFWRLCRQLATEGRA